MPLSRDERLKLRLEILDKELKIKDLASAVKRSPSLISQYLKNQVDIDPSIENKLIEFVKNSPRFQFVKVQVE
jgi:ParB-like chromosome segregation protein Spo0J